MMVIDGTLISENGTMSKFSDSVDKITYPNVVSVNHRGKEFVFRKKLNGEIGVR